MGALEDQARIEHIFISHTHIDHVASLPVFLENVYTPDDRCVKVHGSRAVLDCLRQDLFNNRLWPDFVELSLTNPPFLQMHELEEQKTLEVSGLKITAIPMDHVVPTHGFIVEDEKSCVVFAGDTGPTSALWKEANRRKNVAAVFLECSFPESMAWLADTAKHLTPSQFAEETKKLDHSAPFHAVHIKSFCYEEILAELDALGQPHIHVGKPNHVYEY